MEYLRGKKSLRLRLKNIVRPSESVAKDYYGTIKITKERLDDHIGLIESRMMVFGGLMGFENAVNYAKTTSEDRDIIDASEHHQLYLPYHVFLYFLTRVMKPEIVVETGVERASSTYVMLEAMERNVKGVLHSIELCKEISLPKNVKVPMALMLENEDELKKRWILHTGNSLKVLPQLPEVTQVDLFVSGSDHSYAVQKFELEWAKNHVKPNGVVVCDRNDYSNNQALNEVFPEPEFQRWVLPEKSVESPLKFAVVKT